MEQESKYEEVDKSLKFLTTSSVRNKILMSLRERVKDLGDLKDEMGLGASTIIHSVRDMEKEDLLIEKEDGYHLTQIGKILSHKLFDMVKTLNALNKNREFWLNHQIDGIPQQFLERIGEIKDGKLLKSSPTDLLKVLSVYRELTRKAKEFKGVSPIFVPALPGMMEKVVDRGTDVKLVLTDDILNEIREKHRRILEKVLSKENFRLRRTDEAVKVALTITDSVLSLGLFSNDGTYDFDHDLISHDKEAINWGRELFEYYYNKANKVMAEDI